MSDWKSEIILSQDEFLKFVKSSSKGFMQETDIMDYDVVGSDGTKIGSVSVVEHTAVRGFNTTIHVVQKNIDGQVIVDKSWSA